MRTIKDIKSPMLVLPIAICVLIYIGITRDKEACNPSEISQQNQLAETHRDTVFMKGETFYNYTTQVTSDKQMQQLIDENRGLRESLVDIEGKVISLHSIVASLSDTLEGVTEVEVINDTLQHIVTRYSDSTILATSRLLVRTGDSVYVRESKLEYTAYLKMLVGTERGNDGYEHVFVKCENKHFYVDSLRGFTKFPIQRKYGLGLFVGPGVNVSPQGTSIGLSVGIGGFYKLRGLRK